MLEQEREKFYWHMSLVFMFISPLPIYFLSKISLNPFLKLSLLQQVIWVGCLSSMVVVTLIEMLYTRIFNGKTDFKFWVVNPVAECKNPAIGSIEDCTRSVEKKLNHLGFKTKICPDVSSKPDCQIIKFDKSKKKHISHFLDHGFSGKVVLDPSLNGVDIYAQLKFEDTLIVETGETNKMYAICEFITLKNPELKMKGVPFTLCCGLIVAYATVITSFFVKTGGNLNYDLFNSLALTGIGMILLSLFFTFKNGRDFMSWRLAFSGLYLAAMPYCSWILSKLV
jgi:hypothetical protein